MGTFVKNMTDEQKIKSLRDMLYVMMDWACELPDEYLDSDSETRRLFIEDIKNVKELLRVT